MVVSEVNDTETIVTGLTPGVLYTFSVSAENDVSSQDNNISARSLSTTANTLEGGLCILVSLICTFEREGGTYTVVMTECHLL